MNDFRLYLCGRRSVGDSVVVRNGWWRRSSEHSAPDRVLLDIGILRRPPSTDWNFVSLTPRQARRIAAALLRAADECEGKP